MTCAKDLADLAGKFAGVRGQKVFADENRRKDLASGETGVRGQDLAHARKDLAGGKQTGVRRTGRRTHAGEKNRKQKQKLKPAPRLYFDSGTWSVIGQKQRNPASQSPLHTFYSGSDKLMKVEAFCQNDFVS